MSQVRVGVIGATGAIGKGRCQYFTENPQCELVAVCSRTEDKVREIAGKYGAAAYTRWEDLVADSTVTAVDVASTNTTHHAIAKAALEARKHVCVEYPLAQNLEDYDELFELAKRKGVVLHDALTVRAEGLHSAIRDQFNRLGTPVWAHYCYYGGGGFYVEPELRGNPFIALHIHFVEQMRDVLGEVAWIEATEWDADEGGNKTSGNLMMGFKSGATGYIEFGMGFPASPSYHISFLGSEGLIEYRRGEGLALQTREGKETLTVADINAMKIDTDNFVAQIAEGAVPLSPPEVGRRAIELCLAATQSARENRRVGV